MPESEMHIVAIQTYGSNRVKSRLTGKTVSAYKMGYSSAAFRVLLALYGNQAQDVSSKQASYHYIQILNADVTIHKGYILLKITDEKLEQVEKLTRQVSRPAVYRWQEGHWQDFPCKVGGYKAASYGPSFNPTGMRITSSTTGKVEAAIHQVTAERSKKDPDKPAWWWIRGDTYQHRDLIKRWGGHWSKKRKAWYFIADTLPEAIQALVDEPQESIPELDLGSVDGYERYFNAHQPEGDTGLDLFPDWLKTLITQDQLRTEHNENMVYAKVFMPDGDWYLWIKSITDTGVFCYAVLNGDMQSAEWGWQDIEILEAARGRLNLPMERDTSFRPVSLEAALDQFLKQRGLSDDDVSYIHKGSSPEKQVDSVSIPRGESDTPPVKADEDSQPEHIRVYKPLHIPTDNDSELDQIQTAIVTSLQQIVPQSNTPQIHSCTHRTLSKISQTYVGELTGSVTADVHCYGYAVHEDICVYLNMGGPRSGIEAIRAKLAKGDMVTVVPDTGPAIELTAGEGNTGMYRDYQVNMSEARFVSCILVHDWMIHPNYGGLSTTFILQTSEEQAKAKLLHFVRQLVRIAVFDDWADYLWNAGQTAMLIRKTRGEGSPMITVLLDVDAWTRLCTGGIAENIITLPATAK